MEIRGQGTNRRRVNPPKQGLNCDTCVYRIDALEKRMDKVEETQATIAEGFETVDKIFTWVKRGIPTIITAAVASGIASGKWGAFLHALING